MWGPLVFCLLITTFVALASSSSQTDDIFGVIYATLFGGALVVGVNAHLVGSEGSVLMMCSILGYCLAPFVIAAAVNYFFRPVLMLLGVRSPLV